MATPQPTISALTLAPKHDSVKGSLLNPTTVTESAHTQATSPTSTSTLMAVETVKHTMAPDHPALQQSTSSPARHGSLVENAPRRSPLTSTNPPGPPTLPCVDMGPSTEEQGMSGPLKSPPPLIPTLVVFTCPSHLEGFLFPSILDVFADHVPSDHVNHPSSSPYLTFCLGSSSLQEWTSMSQKSSSPFVPPVAHRRQPPEPTAPQSVCK